MQRRLLWTSMILGVLGVFIGGGLLGYRWSNDHHRPTRPAAKAAPATSAPLNTVPVAEPAARMPDVIGMKPDDAKEALADIGVDSRDVKVVERPYVGTPGLVVIQSPVRGTSDPDQIQLDVSTEAKMPDLKGKSFEEATKALDEFGAAATKEETYVPNAKVGSVLATDPDAGATVTPSVAVRVAASPSSIFVDGVSADSGGCSSGSASAAGTTSDHALSCSATRLYERSDPSPAASYVISGNVDRFTATLGIADDGGASDRARVRVRLNGGATDVFDQIVSFGTPVSLDVDTAGALNLQIYVESPTRGDDDWESTQVVLLDPTFLGASAALDKLPTR